MNKTHNKSAFQRSRRQIIAVVMAVFLFLFIATLAIIYTLSYRELYQENQDMLEAYIDQYRENGNPSNISDSVSVPENAAEGNQSAQNNLSEQRDSLEQSDLPEQDELPVENNSPEQNELPTEDNPPEQNELPAENTMPEQNELPDENTMPSHDATRYLLSSFYSVAFDEDGSVSSVDPGSGTLYTEEQLSAAAKDLLETGQEQGTYGNFIYCIDTEESYTLVVLMDNTLISDSFTTLFRNTLLLGAIMVVLLFVCAIALARWIIRPLEESDRRQRQFISDAGHELKTPVSVVEANVELLEREIGSNKWLNNIRFESSRMAGLVSELLSLLRTEREAPPMESLDFSRLVLGGVLPFESIAFDHGRELNYQIADDITIRGNASLLNQLVSILVDNALSHSAGEGQITVTLRQEKGGTVFSVSNPGFIPEQDRTEIFSRFYRGDATRNDTGHYGLGLTIAKNIAAEHRGEIQVVCTDGLVSFSVRFPEEKKKRHSNSFTLFM
ncbi:MAG: HAMP domain-containing histidine kinase [Lachnospiraceae bacterium]|nr:HAMP domain-containing histidine kinase [Lachnospiraceae bacterium]